MNTPGRFLTWCTGPIQLSENGNLLIFTPCPSTSESSRPTQPKPGIPKEILDLAERCVDLSDTVMEVAIDTEPPGEVLKPLPDGDELLARIYEGWRPVIATRL